MIEIKNLSYTYQKGLSDECQALCDINLKIGDGEKIAIIGHTGSGKSTLAELIAGLIKPASGQVLIDGADISEIKRTELCKKVGIVFQYPENQLFDETVYKDIAFGPKNLGLGGEEIRERVLAAAKTVGLNEADLNKSPFELSGGGQRRAAIAGVLAMKPSVLILDEPMAGLDPRGAENLLDMIESIEDTTVIFISHSMENAAKAAERVIVMNEGRIEMDGSVSEVFSYGERLSEIGLDVPQITRLISKLRLRGFDIQSDIHTAKALAEAIKKLGDF